MEWKDVITWGLLLYIVMQEANAAGCGCGGACGGSGGCADTLSQTTPQWMMGPLRPLSADFSGGMWG